MSADNRNDVPGEVFNSVDSENASVYEYEEEEMQLDQLFAIEDESDHDTDRAGPSQGASAGSGTGRDVRGTEQNEERSRAPHNDEEPRGHDVAASGNSGKKRRRNRRRYRPYGNVTEVHVHARQASVRNYMAAGPGRSGSQKVHRRPRSGGSSSTESSPPPDQE